MLKQFLFCLLLLAAFADVVTAGTVRQLYEVGVPVFTQSDSERKKATQLAFSELLVRITGKREIIDHLESQALIKKSDRYVRSFRYDEIVPPEPIPEPEEDFTELEQLDPELESISLESELSEPEPSLEVAAEMPEPEPQPTQNLVVRFDENAVKNSLWQAKLPVWGKTRPSSLLWIAIQDNETRSMLNTRIPSLVKRQLDAQAIKRGIPVIYPKLDRKDKNDLNVTDVWGGFRSPVTNASRRYQAQAIISASFANHLENQWSSRWYLYLGGEEISWRQEGNSLESLASEGIHVLADKLGERYAYISTTQEDGGFLIHISDVTNLSDYEKVNRYLSSLSAVKKTTLSQVQVNEVVYLLDLRSNKRALKQAIALGKVLKEVKDPLLSEIADTRFSYRLVR